jgi:hypothetical protein
MPQHVRMHRERKRRALPRPRDHLAESGNGDRRGAFGHEREAALDLLALELAQRGQLDTAQRLHRRRTVLHTPHVQQSVRKINHPIAARAPPPAAARAGTQSGSSSRRDARSARACARSP